MRGNPSLCTVIEEEVRNSGPSLFPHSLSHVIKKKNKKKPRKQTTDLCARQIEGYQNRQVNLVALFKFKVNFFILE